MIGAATIPKIPKHLAPAYSAIKVAIGWIPRPDPRIFASIKLRNRLIIANIIRRLKPRLVFCIINKDNAQGTIIKPDPIRGTKSKMATIAAVPIGFLIFILKNPTQRRKKQVIVNRKYDRIYFAIVLIVIPFVSQIKFLIFFGKRFIIKFVVLS